MIFEKGFTLLEILVAMFVFVILATVAVGGLRHMLRTESSIDRHREDLVTLQRTFILLKQDVDQMVKGTFVADDHRMQFTTRGPFNLEGEEQRSARQRVAYVCKDQKIERSTADDAASNVLLEDVTDCHFRYWDDKQHAYTAWRDTSSLPCLIEIELSSKKMGEVVWKFVSAVCD